MEDKELPIGGGKYGFDIPQGDAGDKFMELFKKYAPSQQENDFWKNANMAAMMGRPLKDLGWYWQDGKLVPGDAGEIVTITLKKENYGR